MRHVDNDEDDNSLIMTRNLRLQAGQIVSIDLSGIDGVYGQGGGADENYKDSDSSNRIDGYYSWFTGHLIYAE